MHNMSANTLFKALVCAALLSAGFIIGKYASFPNYHFNPSLDIVAIASLFVNIFLARYISKILNKKNEVDKKGKEIIINRLDKVIGNWELFIVTINSNNIHYNNVTSFIKRNRLAITRICKSYENYYGFSNSNQIFEIGREMNQLNSLMTYTSPYANLSQGMQEPVVIINSIITYTSTRTDEILSKVDVITDKIVKLQLTINSQ